jgi:hypothetical protein
LNGFTFLPVSKAVFSGTRLVKALPGARSPGAYRARRKCANSTSKVHFARTSLAALLR